MQNPKRPVTSKIRKVPANPANKFYKHFSKQSSGKFSKDDGDFLDQIIKATEKNIIVDTEENQKRKEILKQKKEKLKDIHLYENVNLKIYDWNNLFNPSIPIKEYIRKPKKTDFSNTLTKNDFQFPVTLVDLNDEEFNKYLFKSNTNKIGNILKFQNFTNRVRDGERFYFNDYFNNYYKEKFEDFIKKVPILQAKSKLKPERIQRQIKSAQIQDRKEAKIRKIIERKFKDIKSSFYGDDILPKANNLNIKTIMNHYEKVKGIKNLKTYRNFTTTTFADENKETKESDYISRPITASTRPGTAYNRPFTCKFRKPISTKRLILNMYEPNDPDLNVLKNAGITGRKRVFDFDALKINI